MAEGAVSCCRTYFCSLSRILMVSYIFAFFALYFPYSVNIDSTFINRNSTIFYPTIICKNTSNSF